MVAWLAACDVADLSVVVVGELEAGFRLGSRYDENVATLGEFLKEPFVRIQAVTPSIARRYGVIFSALRRAGTPIPVNDIWIAATAMETGGHLVAFDTDFARVEGLAYSVLI